MSTLPTPIQVRGLTKRFRKTTALDGIDFAIEPGTICAYLGPNGAGKTTTIHCLTGIQQPSSGEASLFGVDSRKLGSQEFQRLGYVSENQKLHEWMTVQQLLDYCRPQYPNWDEPFCQQLLAQFELPRDQKIKRLSRGQKMKTSLVSSLAYRPEVLILDEPFSGLDPVVREDFIDGVLELTASGDWTIFVSSHDIDDVERLADRAMVLNEGKIALDESADALRERFRQVSFDLPDEAQSLTNFLRRGCVRARRDVVLNWWTLSSMPPALKNASEGSGRQLPESKRSGCRSKTSIWRSSAPQNLKRKLPRHEFDPPSNLEGRLPIPVADRRLVFDADFYGLVLVGRLRRGDRHEHSRKHRIADWRIRSTV